jgi:hypothetical protein
MNLGLEELMIVNPGPPPVAPQRSWFLGEDGVLYRIDSPDVAGLGGNEPVPRYFLGDDGTLYETE